MLTDERLEELLDQFESCRVAVLGDFFLDKYLDVDPALAETSVETGKVAHQVVRTTCSPGAAGTVVNNLVSLGAGAVHCVGAVGDDGEGASLRLELARRGCDIVGLYCSRDLMTPTYLKPRDATVAGLAGEHSRYDTKNRRPTPDDVVERVLDSLERALFDVDAVIIADQVEADECGIVTTTVRDELARFAASNPKIVFWADSRRRIDRFRNVIVKPNQFEAVGRRNPQPGDEVRLHDLMKALPETRQRNGAPLVVTRGPSGALVSDPDFTLIRGVQVDGPLDTTGAGDSVTAGAVLALAAGATLPEATLIGMLVASITIQQLGTTGVATPDEVLERLTLWRAQG